MTAISKLKIPFAWDLQAINDAHKVAVIWEPASVPHMLIVGATGTGKTYFSRLLLAKLGLYAPAIMLTVCDFKGDDDFTFLQGCQNFYRYLDCGKGLQRFYDEFRCRQSGEDTSRAMRVLFFDEWAAYCNSLDKKEVEDEKKKLATLLMLGRSFGCHVVISQQRADAEYFARSRDNFGAVVALGNISKEAIAMLGFEREIMQQGLVRGEGHLLMDGQGQRAIKVPTVRDSGRVQDMVRSVTG